MEVVSNMIPLALVVYIYNENWNNTTLLIIVKKIRINHRITDVCSDSHHQRPPRDANPVITGTSTNCTLRAAIPRAKLQIARRDGLFISRLSSDSRASDLMDYIRREACLNLRCDPLATRHNSYRSYYIHASPRHHALLLKPGMWPKDVIVKKFTTNGHK